MSITQIKSGKTAGTDNIRPEIMKSDVELTANMLHILFREIRAEEKVPLTYWKRKGYLNKCVNYRDITLLSVSGKVFNRVLLNRLKDSVDTQLQDQQAGLRKDRPYINQTATLRIIVEQPIEWNSSLYISFIDHEKVFDSMDRRTLWKLPRHYGIPEKIVSIIRNSCDGLQCDLVHSGHFTDASQVVIGVTLLLNLILPLSSGG
uniref:Reverse transcriptase domain-containing protein n=1 Tax=Schistosoma curassoni TaxID=6186 RepID=A0A183K1Y7_9TREM